MSLAIPGHIQSTPWSGVYPGDGVPGMTPDGWIEAFCALYVDTGRCAEDWEAWRIARLGTNEEQFRDLVERMHAPPDASVA